MSAAPRLEIDLDRIQDNARELVGRLDEQGISITGVTKVAAGSVEIANALLRGGIKELGDSRIENIEALRAAHPDTPMQLIRTPMLSQTARVVRSADSSLNSELAVIRGLSEAAYAAGLTHGIVLMVELGDLREGFLPRELKAAAQLTLELPNLVLLGIGTNLACCSGVSPDAQNMGELSSLARSLESAFDQPVGVVSGGNSGNLGWALSGISTDRINNLRLGEAVLLGRETLHRQPIRGLHTDAIWLIAEVIEFKLKPTQPRGEIAQAALGGQPRRLGVGPAWQAILAIGHQDIDPAGLVPPTGVRIVAASSDHLVVHSTCRQVSVGTELRFGVNYSALVRAMTSPYVAKVMQEQALPCTAALP